MSQLQKYSLKSTTTYSLSVSLATSIQFFGFPIRNKILFSLNIIFSFTSIVLLILFVFVRRKVEMPKKIKIFEICFAIVVITSSFLYSIFLIKVNNSNFQHNLFFIAIINFVLMLISIVYTGYNTKRYIVNRIFDKEVNK